MMWFSSLRLCATAPLRFTESSREHIGVRCVSYFPASVLARLDGFFLLYRFWQRKPFGCNLIKVQECNLERNEYMGQFVWNVACCGKHATRSNLSGRTCSRVCRVMPTHRTFLCFLQEDYQKNCRRQWEKLRIHWLFLSG